MDNIYHEIILDIYKNPLNKEKPANFDISKTEHNTNCGDIITIFAKFKGDKIDQIGWQGEGCAVSQASASLTTDYAKGKTKNQIKKITADKILHLLGLTNLNPTRLRCALLCLETLKKSVS